ncbi:MAG: EamA family transporter, partial [Geminicoccales bacterium]
MIGDSGHLRLPRAAQGWQRSWLLLPVNLRGALWVILSCLCIGTTAALVKSLGARLDSFELNFFRAAFGLLSVLPFALKAGPAVLRTRHPLLHLGRGIFGTVGMMSAYFALTRLPLADATAIT